MRPLAVTIGPPKLGTPYFILRGTGARSLTVPNGSCHIISPDFKSIAAKVPQGGGLQGRPNPDKKVSRLIAYGVPACGTISTPGLSFLACSYSSFGIRVTIQARSITLATRICLFLSTAIPPQLDPPELPGYIKVACPNLGGV